MTLVRRGYRTPEEARAFLDADESHPTRRLRLDGERWSSGSRAAIAAGQRITVHGDFDVDGVCATAIMVGTLRELGADCDWLIPDRIARRLRPLRGERRAPGRAGHAAAVTVDCGITAVEEVALARELGMEVIVTDHHQRRRASSPIARSCIRSSAAIRFDELCGTAVAWKLACALRRRPTSRPDLDLVALATVADVVPLVGENRSLVRRGLEAIRRVRAPGHAGAGRGGAMRADAASTRATSPSAWRRGSTPPGASTAPMPGVELFLDRGRGAGRGDRRGAEPRQLASGAPTEREVDTAAEAARRELPESCATAPALVLAGEGWHPGVIGIVASRLVERHHRPAIVISLDGEGPGRGSGRSIPGFDLLAALEACSEHLARSAATGPPPGCRSSREPSRRSARPSPRTRPSVLGPEELPRTERIDAMVGGAEPRPRAGRGAAAAWPRSGWATPACGCWSRRRGSATCVRWGKASTPASACTAARTARSASPSAASSLGVGEDEPSTPPSGSRSTTGTARSSRGSSSASSIRAGRRRGQSAWRA